MFHSDCASLVLKSKKLKFELVSEILEFSYKEISRHMGHMSSLEDCLHYKSHTKVSLRITKRQVWWHTITHVVRRLTQEGDRFEANLDYRV